MEKIKSVLSGHRKSMDNPQAEASSLSPTAPTSGNTTHQATSRNTTQHATSSGLAGEGSHLPGATEERHPIYDQFAGSGHPTKTTESPPHFSNTTNVRSDFPGSGEPGQSTVDSTLSPDSKHSRPGVTDEMSTASIKSGVIGFPQSGSSGSHAAMEHIPERGFDNTNSGMSGLPHRTVPGENINPSHHGKDAALGAGALGAGAVGGHELSHRRDHADLRRSAERDTEPSVVTDTDRSFPLAGGVTHRQAANEPSTTHSTNPSATEQITSLNTSQNAGLGAGALGAGALAGHETGTRHKDKTSALPTQQSVDPITEHTHPHTGRDAALGTDALGTGALTGHESRNRHEDNTSAITTQRSVEPTPEQIPSHTGRNAALGAGALSAGALAGHELNNHHNEGTDARSKDRSLGSNKPTTQEQSSGLDDSRQTLAMAAAAAAPSSAYPQPGQEYTVDHSHGGLGHKYAGDPCEHETTDGKPKGLLFTDGPHATDTANRTDPRFHIPGEFPDPTPVEEVSQPTFGQEAGHQSAAPVIAGGAGDTSRYYPTGTQGLPDQSQQSASEHHYGRDAALGGAGVAAAGGLYASQREHKPDTGPADATIGPHKSNVMNVLDPRVQPDPVLQKHHEARSTPEDPATKIVGPHTSNVANVVDARVQPEPEEMKGHTTTGPHQFDTLNRLDPKAEQQTQDHHYGRDAALAGGAGAAGLGAYEAGKHHRESNDTAAAGEELYHREANPYTSKKLDPRVHGRTPIEEQRFDPTASKEPATSHHGRDAALVGGAGLAGHEASTHHHSKKNRAPIQSTQPQANHPLTETQTEPSQVEHHYGRDAVLAGGSGAVGYEAYKHRPGQEDSALAQPTETQASQPLSQTRNGPLASELHLRRDTAVVEGTGASGYESSKHLHGQHENISGQQGQQGQRQVNEPFSQTQNKGLQSENHHGRDAAVVGGTGAAGLGAYEAAQKYDQHRSTQPSASMNDQRFDPSSRSTQDPTQTSQHHYGRDAALVGGAGLASAGAYAATRPHDEPAQRSVGQTDMQHQDPPQTSQHHYGRDAALVGGAGLAGAGAHSATRPHDESTQHSLPQSNLQHQDPTQTSQYHYGRDAGLVGGAGLAGAGAYAATRPHDEPAERSVPQNDLQQTAVHNRYDSVQNPDDKQPQDHHKRDVAALGATGAVAGAGAGYALSHHEAEKAEKERLAQQKAQEKAQQKELEHAHKQEQKDLEHKQKEAEKEHAKELKHQQKEHEKELAHKQKEHEKEQAKEQKHHDKLVAAEEKQHQKDAEHQESIRQKQLEKEQEDNRRKDEEAAASTGDGKKKHHLFGFLHRNKDKHADDKSDDGSGSPRHSKEYAAGAAGVGAAGIGAGAYEASRHSEDSDNPNSPRWKGKNKLHKDPPPGHPAREALEGQGQGVGKQEHMGVDGPIGNPDLVSGDRETKSGVYGAHAPDEQQHRVIEPHTGLPMNVEKYGDGKGGTDGSNTVLGHHDLSHSQVQGQGMNQGQGQAQAQAQAHGTTDWEGIKKANTPY
ncbi:hypothetical protein BCR34DRAFT_42314 [Clohesyomyces aquaticus]|uniref:Uncharacterized protein n=1 Tax=Clohesyomyces aquaticus TaxID=1231657 RepID=A0A1Y1Z6P3_9PLEO|nr:hypothetical protein BCR34DRAFT_42314 [Clohesyomyces aquaticus]